MIANTVADDLVEFLSDHPGQLARVHSIFSHTVYLLIRDNELITLANQDDIPPKGVLVDCASADHPVNTKIRDWEPGEAQTCDAYMKQRFGKDLNEIYPWQEQYQAMHTKVFPKPWEIIHVENIGGVIDKVLNRRLVLDTLPWKFQYAESAFCRCIAIDEVE